MGDGASSNRFQQNKTRTAPPPPPHREEEQIHPTTASSPPPPPRGRSTAHRPKGKKTRTLTRAHTGAPKQTQADRHEKTHTHTHTHIHTPRPSRPAHRKWAMALPQTDSSRTKQELHPPPPPPASSPPPPGRNIGRHPKVTHTHTHTHTHVDQGPHVEPVFLQQI